jgi:hypothetical protein
MINDIIDLTSGGWPTQQEVDARLEQEEQRYIDEMAKFFEQSLANANDAELEVYDQIVDEIKNLAIPQYDISNVREQMVAALDNNFTLDELADIKVFLNSDMFNTFERYRSTLVDLDVQLRSEYEAKMKSLFSGYPNRLIELKKQNKGHP